MNECKLPATKHAHIYLNNIYQNQKLSKLNGTKEIIDYFRGFNRIKQKRNKNESKQIGNEEKTFEKVYSSPLDFLQ